MRDPLLRCIENIGTAPRQFSAWDRFTYLAVRKPFWVRMDPTEELATHFQNLDTVLTNGLVVWGHIIQANQLLFQAGSDNCPGELVYSVDATNRCAPEYLQQVAFDLYSLKGTRPADPELRFIAEYLTNERIRVFGLTVPAAISPRHRCMISTTYFVRKHLPARQLCSPILPILVNPRQPHAAMPLPRRYWPDDFAKQWSGQARKSVASNSEAFDPSLQRRPNEPFWLWQTKRLFPHPVFAGCVSFACLLVAVIFLAVAMSVSLFLLVVSVAFFAAASVTFVAAISSVRDKKSVQDTRLIRSPPPKPTFAIFLLLIGVYSWLLMIAMHVFRAFFKNGPGTTKYYVTLAIAVTSTLFMQMYGKRVVRKHFGSMGGRKLVLSASQCVYVAVFVICCGVYAFWLAS